MSNNGPQLTVLQAVAVFALWERKRFDTSDIAAVFCVPEGMIANLLHSVKEHASTAPLTVIKGGKA